MEDTAGFVPQRSKFLDEVSPKYEFHKLVSIPALNWCAKALIFPSCLVFPTDGKSSIIIIISRGEVKPQEVFALCCLPNTASRSFLFLLYSSTHQHLLFLRQQVLLGQQGNGKLYTQDMLIWLGLQKAMCKITFPLHIPLF